MRGVVVLLAVVTAAGCTGDDDPPPAPAAELRVDVTELAPHTLPVVATSDDRGILVWGQDTTSPAAPTWSTTDGGLTWAQGPDPGVSGEYGVDTGGGGYTTSLDVVGDRVLAWDSAFPDYSVPVTTAPVRRIAVSADRGATWAPADLPAPEGYHAVVQGAADVDGRWLVGGALEADVVPAPGSPLELSLAAYDAAVWEWRDGAFVLLGTDGLRWQPGAAHVTDLVSGGGGTIVAVGRRDDVFCCRAQFVATSWRSADGGLSWQPVPGVDVPGPLSTVLVDPATGRPAFPLFDPPGAVLTQDATSWQPLAVSTADPDPLRVSGLDVGGGRWVRTWSDYTPSDVSDAFGAAYDADGSVGEPQGFDLPGCEPGFDAYELVGAPVALTDGVVAAAATCGGTASVVHTSDGGITWTVLPVVSGDVPVAVVDPVASSFGVDGALVVVGAVGESLVAVRVTVDASA